MRKSSIVFGFLVAAGMLGSAGNGQARRLDAGLAAASVVGEDHPLYFPIVSNSFPLIILADAFSGSGPLTSHIPDISPAGSEWSIKSGSFADLDGSGILNFESGYDGKAIINAGVNDLDLTARFRVIDGQSEELGVIIRGDEALDNYVQAHINSTTDGASIGVFGSGGAATGAFPLNNSTFYTLRIVSWGKSIRMFVNGAPVAGSDANTNPGTFVGLSKLGGSTGKFWDWIQVRKVNESEWKRLTFIGDSITSPKPGWTGRVSNIYNGSLTRPFNHAFPGAHASNSEFAWQVNDTVTQNDQMDYSIILLGTNDGAVNVTANYTAQLINLWTLWPGKPIFAMGVLNRNPDRDRSIMNGYIAAAVAAAQSAGVDATYWNTDGWIDPLSDTYDGLHPNAAGNAKIADQVLARLP